MTKSLVLLAFAILASATSQAREAAKIFFNPDGLITCNTSLLGVQPLGSPSLHFRLTEDQSYPGRAAKIEVYRYKAGGIDRASRIVLDLRHKRPESIRIVNYGAAPDITTYKWNNVPGFDEITIKILTNSYNSKNSSLNTMLEGKFYGSFVGITSFKTDMCGSLRKQTGNLYD